MSTKPSQPSPPPDDPSLTRRAMLGDLARIGGVLGLVVGLGAMVRRSGGCSGGSACDQCGKLATCDLDAARAMRQGTYWQIDPAKCTQCGKCATTCVLSQSAVRCFHRFAICGYCDVCTGYLDINYKARDTAAENQMCPTGAIGRNNVENDYFAYTIDRDACIGCARCVKGCVAFGNGSLYLQIDQKVCTHCNNCSIAAACPAGAISRVDCGNMYREPRLKGSTSE